MDEAIFAHDTKAGRRFWEFIGQRITVPYTGSHRRTVAYGALTDDGRQMFRSYPKFTKEEFIKYLKDFAAKFGKIAVICDKAPPAYGEKGE